LVCKLLYDEVIHLMWSTFLCRLGGLVIRSFIPSVSDIRPAIRSHAYSLHTFPFSHL
jgi:hypothetical protein